MDSRLTPLPNSTMAAADSVLFSKPVEVPLPSQYQRLVHLDLKGAPLKMDFLSKLIVKLKEWGATGLLVEYEDTFPYTGDLTELALPSAYSLADLKVLQQLARDNDMEYIPVVQTFGHLEYVLKHNKFVHLREVPEFPTSICPSKEDSLLLIQELLDQVIQAHDGLKYFSIGADEVVHLGCCHKCQHRIETDLGGFGCSLYLDHVTKVLQYIRKQHPGITCIMWDDMLRTIDPKLMNDVKLGELVEPMVWNYSDDTTSFRLRFHQGMWENYSQVFKHFWIATAFKGAFGHTLYWPPSKLHVQNHLLWLQELDKTIPKTLTLRGCVLTGWQRYDHLSVLCELLPTALPCLALCLQVLLQGGYSHDVLERVSKQLGFTEPFQIEVPQHTDSLSSEEAFPSSDLYSAIQDLVIFEASPRFKDFMSQSQLHANMDPNARIATDLPMVHYSVEESATEAKSLVGQLEAIRQRARAALGYVYHTTTKEEWLELRINPILRALKMFVGGGSMDEVREEEEDEMELGKS
ncbi:hexosaminidase D-like [Acanthaster planci]|uniref:beta-N-acetylhexosaminidase n=1 Tax=Acanthaster planci TaxID=133434 RepID=A0A8B7YAB1_ACAPL|nr:hexosaminidase D-like [Acanthaster planci]XP_022089310.1 hexosaminidase D-like [Acanthaster planci]